MTLSPGAALVAWASVLVALNLTGHPLVSAATFTGLVLLAMRAGLRRLVLLALIVGLAMLLVVPGVSIVDRSFEVAYADGAWRMPSGVDGWLAATGSALRIPAQVLAATLLMLVPARLLLAATSRLSPRTALLGGLAARLRPLLARDLRLMRDELEGRGLRIGRGAPLGERARGVLALWEAAVSGMLDRALQTAATLEARGYGAAAPVMDELAHPALHDGVRRHPGRDRLLLVAAVALVVAVIAGRSTGALAAPAMQALGDSSAPINASVVVAALLGAMLGVIPIAIRADRGSAVHASCPGGRSLRAASSSGPLELVVEGVSMRYPASEVDSLHDVSLRVAPGELVVVTGPSGSGKSTLLDVVTGVAPRATGGTRRGTIRLGNHLLGATRVHAGARIAAVFQEPESQVLVGQVAEEVAFGLRHAGVDVQSIARRVLEVLDHLDLAHLARRDCATLSGGELQRVLLAAALVLEPAILVLDEPTSQVDAGSERRFWDAVDRVRAERGIGVIVAEHRLDNVLARADRVCVFEAGCLVAELRPAQLATAAPSVLAGSCAGLSPLPPTAAAAPRLVVHIDRLEVESRGCTKHTLLRGLSFALPPGAIATLEGPNGAGKSTLLRAIRGLHAAPGGVLVDGVARGGVGDSVDRIGYLSQGAGALLPGRTVRHAVEDTCRRRGIDVAAAHAAVDAAGLADRIDSHPCELSVGERQRLALVAATAHRPAIWLLDEPTRGMDTASRRWVACHVLAHAAAGGVVLVATHDPQLAAAIATHRLRLDLRTGPSLLTVERGDHGELVDPPAASPAAASHDRTAMR